MIMITRRKRMFVKQKKNYNIEFKDNSILSNKIEKNNKIIIK